MKQSHKHSSQSEVSMAFSVGMESRYIQYSGQKNQRRQETDNITKDMQLSKNTKIQSNQQNRGGSQDTNASLKSERSSQNFYKFQCKLKQDLIKYQQDVANHLEEVSDDDIKSYEETIKACLLQSTTTPNNCQGGIEKDHYAWRYRVIIAREVEELDPTNSSRSNLSSTEEMKVKFGAKEFIEQYKVASSYSQSTSGMSYSSDQPFMEYSQRSDFEKLSGSQISQSSSNSKQSRYSNQQQAFTLEESIILPSTDSQCTILYSTQNSQASALKISQIAKILSTGGKRTFNQKQKLDKSCISNDAQLEMRQILEKGSAEVKIPESKEELEDKFQSLFVRAHFPTTPCWPSTFIDEGVKQPFEQSSTMINNDVPLIFAKKKRYPLDRKKRVKVLLEHNMNYKTRYNIARDHLKFQLYTDDEIGFPSEQFTDLIHDSHADEDCDSDDDVLLKCNRLCKRDLLELLKMMNEMKMARIFTKYVHNFRNFVIPLQKRRLGGQKFINY
ncbi:UNKNOWN [Stylonychia lemnae]|uniref:Uncharacterized protein n=1 Tax=Stylonychia lemnae TaxID=5949 RepID=A0A077ZV82_STYLE|nr:UNKNOWN [Stylonychia lemnae]|eukprot:CDW73799.1 UNKNOWN [Stylonychia lemnae]